MTDLARKSLHWLSDEPHRLIGLQILQISIGFLVLFRVFTEAPFARYLYGPYGIADGSMQRILGSGLGGLLDSAFATDVGTYAVLVTAAVGALGLVFGYRTRLATLVALVPFFMLEQRLPEIGDGGDNIARLTLIYLLFALPVGARYERKSLSVFVHNVAVVAILVQLCILYETSGMYKVMGDKWTSGTALYYISQVEWFSHPAVREMFKDPVITTTSTYLPMIFLIFFPMAIFTRFRKLWIAIGVCFHLGIALTMGLVTFAMVMIGLEMFVLSDDEHRALGRYLAEKRRALRARLPWLRPAEQPQVE